MIAYEGRVFCHGVFVGLLWGFVAGALMVKVLG